MWLFHGTSSKFKDDILKNGLQPSSKKLWSNSNYNIDVPSQNSLYGIYLSLNKKISEGSALNCVRCNGGSPIIIKCDIDISKCYDDEDNINSICKMIVTTIFEKYNLNFFDDIFKFLAIYDIDFKYINNIFYDYIKNEIKINSNKESFDKLLYLFLKRIAIHFYKQNKEVCIYSYQSFHKKFSKPTRYIDCSIEQIECEYRELVDYITRYNFSNRSTYRYPHIIKNVILEELDQYLQYNQAS